MGAINLSKKNIENLCRNGSFNFWQEHISFIGFNNSKYLSDMFQVVQNTGPFGTRDLTRETDVPNADTKYSMKFEVATASGVIPNGDFVGIQYRMEGNDLIKLADKNGVIPFWIKSNVVGKKSMTILNGGSQNVRIFKSYTIEQADTWEQKTIKLNFKEAMALGVWNFDNNLALTINWNLDYGSDFFDNDEDVWKFPSANLGPDDAMNDFHETVGNYIQFAQVMVHEGIDKLPKFKLAGGTYDEEQVLVQRYYEKSYRMDKFPGDITDPSSARYSKAADNPGTRVHIGLNGNFDVEKRGAPVVSFFNHRGNGLQNYISRYNADDNRSVTLSIGTDTKGISGYLETGVAISDSAWGWHYTADSRL